MPLTHDERRFLDAFVYEATQGPPFGGLATNDLKQRGIRYHDLSWVLTAYQRELSGLGISPTGQQNLQPPPSPWNDLEQVRRRNEVLKDELERRAAACHQGVP